MAHRTDGETDGCTFQWTITDISHCWWLKTGEAIESPSFTADALQGTKWSLSLYPVGYTHGHSMGFFLRRKGDCSGPDIIKVKYQLALLDRSGSKLNQETELARFMKGDSCGYKNFESRERIFITGREELLPEDTLTVQCKIWKGTEKPVKSKYIHVRTVFKANRRVFALRICKFPPRATIIDGTLDFDLIWNRGTDFEEEMIIKINSFDDRVKYFSFKTFITDSEGRKDVCGMNEFVADDLKKGELSFMLNFPKRFMEDKNQYFQNCARDLYCELVFSTETVIYEPFGSGISTELKCQVVENKNEHYVEKEKSQTTSALTT